MEFRNIKLFYLPRGFVCVFKEDEKVVGDYILEKFNKKALFTLEDVLAFLKEKVKDFYLCWFDGNNVFALAEGEFLKDKDVKLEAIKLYELLLNKRLLANKNRRWRR